jgi:hypothetical protein
MYVEPVSLVAVERSHMVPNCTAVASVGATAPPTVKPPDPSVDAAAVKVSLAPF